MAKQLTWIEANRLAEKVAERSCGFLPVNPNEKVTLTRAQLREEGLRLARNVAIIAFREVGLLDELDQREKRATEYLASKAEQAHDAWKKATGSRC